MVEFDDRRAAAVLFKPLYVNVLMVNKLPYQLEQPLSFLLFSTQRFSLLLAG